jgi:translation initiation factor IF-1
MVRNTKGGKGSKGLARKLVSYSHSAPLRLPDNDLEVFAIVTKIYGPMCEVTTNSGVSLKCHIRGKFKGRAKRNSIITVGSIILVGFRDFEAPNFKSCDLLEVYSNDETHQLSLSSHLSQNITNLLNNGSCDSDLLFNNNNSNDNTNDCGYNNIDNHHNDNLNTDSGNNDLDLDFI